MCNRNDADFVGHNLIEDTVGKPTKNIPPPGATKDRADVWVRQYTACGPVKLGNEREAKPGIRACSVKGGSIVQFAKRKRDDDQLHFRAARTLARASAIGMT